LYKDLTPYLILCPDVYANMQQYDYVMDTVSRRGKIYALYAGVPEISHIALIVKKEILQKYNILSVGGFDDLYGLMERMTEQEGNKEENKIFVNERILLKNAVIKACYYLGYDGNRNLNPYNIVCKPDDEDYKPILLIEDTDVFDVFFNEYGRFFQQSYFKPFPYDPLSAIKPDEQFYRSFFSKNGGGIYLLDNIFYSIYRLFDYDEYPEEYPWNTYSAFLLDNENPIVNTIDSIQLILVPYTCDQPEKAVSFVNWLYTDEKIADLLTFGSNQGKNPNDAFTREGNIMYKERNSVYRFYNLIASFSDRLLPYDNKALDVSEEYLRLARKAVYPPLYRRLESIHSIRYEAYQNASYAFTQNDTMKKRTEYITKAVEGLLKDPLFVTAFEMKRDLDNMTNCDELMQFINENIRGID
jgi:hypothetical protein